MRPNTTTFVAIALFCSLSSLTIAEKRHSLVSSIAPSEHGQITSIEAVNQELVEKRYALEKLYQESTSDYKTMHETDASDEEIAAFFEERRKHINELRCDILRLQNTWKQVQKEDDTEEQEALWHQPDTTIGQLVMDYGSMDYIYLVPPDITPLKVHLSSQLSVPSASWNEMLELILAHYGIGIKKLTPFLRQLYFMKSNQSGLFTITDDEKELTLTPADARIGFVLSPEATELHRIYTFLAKFVPHDQMGVQVIGNALVLVGRAEEVREILKIYRFISSEKYTQAYELITLQRADSEEMANILLSLFEGKTETLGQQQNDMREQISSSQSEDTAFGFRVITLKQPAQSLFLLGRPEQLEKARTIIHDVENKITEVQEKEIYWYACRHSEAGELAEILSLVYTKMIETPSAFSIKDKRAQEIMRLLRRNAQREEKDPSNSSKTVTSSKITSSDPNKNRTYTHHENFIVDNKTNSIVMVVETCVLPKIKELLQKIDVPKKMVQIDVLLFEKRVADSNTFGLNLLRFGDAATNKNTGSLLWNDSRGVPGRNRRKGKKHRVDTEPRRGPKGLLQFILTRSSSGDMPAFDLAYNFLLSQENIQINASPSVTMLNQTTAKIAVVDQISVNTGAVEFGSSDRVKDSFSREEYGIIINLTPTIHAKAHDSSIKEARYITLSTDIIFDTTRPNAENRPDVTRRNIKNEVRVKDGETVILGGLRRKIASETQESIPFLGEIPGIGKFFSTTSIEDQSTEMYIFITPRILPDETEERLRMRRKEFQRRPGDLPEFLEELAEAQALEKQAVFERSLNLLFGSMQATFTK